MAPFEVGFLAYTNFYAARRSPSPGCCSSFGLFVVLTLAPKVFPQGIPFATGWWAISFPMAALALCRAEIRDVRPGLAPEGDCNHPARRY
ncbi:hypothetical protein ACU4GD_31150 [Cupriavidus basilensis]